MTTATLNQQEFDKVISDIVDYVTEYPIVSDLAYDTAYYCFLDTLGCGMESLEYPACKNCSVLSFQVRSCLMAQKYLARNFNSTLYRPLSILAP